jgi:hypothetical protein
MTSVARPESNDSYDGSHLYEVVAAAASLDAPSTPLLLGDVMAETPGPVEEMPH